MSGSCRPRNDGVRKLNERGQKGRKETSIEKKFWLPAFLPSLSTDYQAVIAREERPKQSHSRQVPIIMETIKRETTKAIYILLSHHHGVSERIRKKSSAGL
jgi:hypothetical protein